MTERDPANIELDMLRAFYASWVALHKIPRDKLHRRKQEAAAQLMVDNSHDLRRFYQAHDYRDPVPQPHAYIMSGDEGTITFCQKCGQSPGHANHAVAPKLEVVHG